MEREWHRQPVYDMLKLLYKGGEAPIYFHKQAYGWYHENGVPTLCSSSGTTVTELASREQCTIQPNTYTYTYNPHIYTKAPATTNPHLHTSTGTTDSNVHTKAPATIDPDLHAKAEAEAHPYSLHTTTHSLHATTKTKAHPYSLHA